MLSRLQLAIAVFVVATFFAGDSHANIITNPSFETGDFTGWTHSGDTSLSGVTTLQPHSGTYGAEFGPPTPGFLTQTLATTPGAEYEIQFWLANGFDLQPNFFSVSFDGVVLDSLTNAGFFGYTLFDYTAVASSASTDLVFTFMHPPHFWFFDDVSVVATDADDVPEPESLLLIGAGLITLLTLRRRAARRSRFLKSADHASY